MKLKETILIGLMALMSLSLMQSDAGRVRANEFVQPPFDSIATTNESEIAGLLAMAQLAPNQTPRSSAAHTNTMPESVSTPGSSPQFVDECMEIAEQINPRWAAQMRKACENTPEALERSIRRSSRILVALVELRRRDPQLYQIKIDELQIESQINELVHRLGHLHSIGKGIGPEAGELKEELYAQVQQQVALSLKARGLYIQRLKNHIKNLEDQITQDAFSFLKTSDERYRTLIDMD